MEAVFENSVQFNQIENGPPETLDIFLVLDFQRREVRYHLGANFFGCGGADVFEVYDDQCGFVVSWLDRVKAQAVEGAIGANGLPIVSEEIASVITRYPEAFDRLIEKVQILQKWLNASEKDVNQALTSDPKPEGWPESVDPLLHFLANV